MEKDPNFAVKIGIKKQDLLDEMQNNQHRPDKIKETKKENTNCKSLDKMLVSGVINFGSYQNFKNELNCNPIDNNLNNAKQNQNGPSK